MSGAIDLVLDVKNLKTVFFTNSGLFKAVDDVSFSVRRGETLAIVGESGCGKSVSALSVMRLVPDPPGRIVGGTIELESTDLLALDEAKMRAIRGNRISMIFQEPMTSLNPSFTVGFQLMETLRVHEGLDRGAARRRATELVEQVGIPAAASRLKYFPHQLSGGMNQRVMIAMAIACNPKVLIADEPTTALDVTIQAQILELLLSLQRDRGMALILITHNMGVVADTARRVAVMYAGEIVEERSAADLFAAPQHPYTAALLAARPECSEGGPLATIPGVVPGPADLPGGCLFGPRCAFATLRSRKDRPLLRDWLGGRVRCHYPLGDLTRDARMEADGPAAEAAP